MLFFGKTGVDAEMIFNQGIHANFNQDGNFGKGFYFYKSAQAALKNVAFKEGKRALLFGLTLIGETTNNQTEKGFMP
jgi:hypothetical protein